MVVWKYQLERTPRQFVELPIGYRILSAAMQGVDLFMWVMLDPDEPLIEKIEIEVVGTGELIGAGNPVVLPNRRREFIETVLDSGSLVWHVFEVQL